MRRFAAFLLLAASVPAAGPAARPIQFTDQAPTGGALVLPLALAALGAGADGLIVEVHPAPSRALSDGDQSLALDGFAELMGALRPLAVAVGRHVAPAVKAVPLRHPGPRRSETLAAQG